MATGSYVQVTNGVGPKLATGPIYSEAANNLQDQKVLLGEPYVASYTFTAKAVTVAASTDHTLQIMAGSSLNIRLRRIWIYSATAPAAASPIQWDLLRLSSAGTGGGVVTARPMDASDAAAGATAMTLPTVLGATGVTLLTIRKTLLPYASRNDGERNPVWEQQLGTKPFIIPAGVANGIVLKNNSPIATATVDVVVEFIEVAF